MSARQESNDSDSRQALYELPVQMKSTSQARKSESMDSNERSQSPDRQKFPTTETKTIAEVSEWEEDSSAKMNVATSAARDLTEV